MQAGFDLTQRALSGEVQLTERPLTEHLDELATRDLAPRPEENVRLGFSADTAAVCGAIRRMGTVVTGDAWACRTIASGDGLQRCVVGRRTAVSVTAKDRDGNPCRAGVPSLTAELSIVGKDGVTQGEVSEQQDGIYEVLYTVEKEGRYLLAIRLNGQHINGSPFNIHATQDGQRRAVTPKHHVATPRSARKKESPLEDDLLFRIGTEPFNIQIQSQKMTPIIKR